ncbi:hypothetical protein CSUI_005467, partial [Cystoisospora suis]
GHAPNPPLSSSRTTYGRASGTSLGVHVSKLLLMCSSARGSRVLYRARCVFLGRLDLSQSSPKLQKGETVTVRQYLDRRQALFTTGMEWTSQSRWTFE